MEKVRLVTFRKYLMLSCNRYFFFKGHKKYEQSLLIDITQNSGQFSLEFTNRDTNETIKIENEFKETIEFPLIKGNRYSLQVTAKGACGSYKIRKKTIKE